MIGSLLNEKKADIDKELANLLADNGSELYKSNELQSPCRRKALKACFVPDASRNIRLRGKVLYEGCLCYRMYPYIFPYP